MRYPQNVIIGSPNFIQYYGLSSKIHMVFHTKSTEKFQLKVWQVQYGVRTLAIGFPNCPLKQFVNKTLF